MGIFQKFFLINLLVLSLNANELLNDKIKNLIGENSYATHKNLINFIFKKDYEYTTVNGLNYIAILKTLKENGLLNLAFNEPRDIEINFKIIDMPVKSMKILKDTLKSLGYYYYFTKKAVYNGENDLTWTIKLKTEAAIDPLILSDELSKHDCKILDIHRESNEKWSYVLNTQEATLSDAVHVTTNEKVVFTKPLSPYFIKIDSATYISIVSRRLNNWLPYVVFYDKNLNILKVSKDDKVNKSLTLKIPEKTKYIKISDLYTLFNIKRGLSVTIKE